MPSSLAVPIGLASANPLLLPSWWSIYFAMNEPWMIYVWWHIYMVQWGKWVKVACNECSAFPNFNEYEAKYDLWNIWWHSTSTLVTRILRLLRFWSNLPLWNSWDKNWQALSLLLSSATSSRFWIHKGLDPGKPQKLPLLLSPGNSHPSETKMLPVAFLRGLGARGLGGGVLMAQPFLILFNASSSPMLCRLSILVSQRNTNVIYFLQIRSISNSEPNGHGISFICVSIAVWLLPRLFVGMTNKDGRCIEKYCSASLWSRRWNFFRVDNMNRSHPIQSIFRKFKPMLLRQRFENGVTSEWIIL